MSGYTNCESVITNDPVDFFWQPFLGPDLILNRVFLFHVVYAVINHMLRYTYYESVITYDPVDFFDNHFASSPLYKKK